MGYFVPPRCKDVQEDIVLHGLGGGEFGLGIQPSLVRVCIAMISVQLHAARSSIMQEHRQACLSGFVHRSNRSILPGHGVGASESPEP